ncbi:Mur ligase family protein [Alphaproteobacteria bacterium]|nr:Mur ligase family protein [Alphaproteobacteria bacterium]
MKDPIFQRLLQFHPKFSDLSLGRINQLLKKIGFNEKKIPKVIHIAGTNGKGSTAAILKSILNHHGYSTHVYTTPHLVDFNERIQLNSKNISNKKLLEYLRYCEQKNDGKLITFFEITTAAAFKAFQDHQADFLILEVGLGGRFDATNILKLPKFAAVTPISLDHQDFLGNSLNKIAFEKLGILNQKSINFINKQKPSVMNFIHSELKRRGLRAKFFGENWKIKSNAYLSNNIKIDLSSLNLQGKHQKINAGLAIHIARHILQKKFDLPLTQKALTHCQWPGRMQSITKGFLFQKLKNFKDITLDGFHNIDGMNMLIQNLPTNRKILICSFLNNKKYTQMLTKLSEHFQKIIVVQMNEENSITKKDLPANLKLIFCPSLKNSVKTINQYSNSLTSIYFGGSLYFIGEFLKLNQSK